MLRYAVTTHTNTQYTPHTRTIQYKHHTHTNTHTCELTIHTTDTHTHTQYNTHPTHTRANSQYTTHTHTHRHTHTHTHTVREACVVHCVVHVLYYTSASYSLYSLPSCSFQRTHVTLWRSAMVQLRAVCLKRVFKHSPTVSCINVCNVCRQDPSDPACSPLYGVAIPSDSVHQSVRCHTEGGFVFLYSLSFVYHLVCV
ncbi:unnamed protein product [Arctogadus glacialis]